MITDPAERAALLLSWRNSGTPPEGVSLKTLYRWKQQVKGRPVGEWARCLAPNTKGRTATATLHPAAWEYIKADWLRLEAPAASAVYRRAVRLADKEGWGELPSYDTVLRRLNAIRADVRILAREGERALERLTPYQIRSHFEEANAAWNLDGHTVDVWVRWPDGEILRPTLLVLQDVRSRRWLSHVLDKSENREATRLVFAQAIDTFGPPDKVYIDNSRAFNSKWITGGMPSRFRFKIKPEDPKGLLTRLGIQVTPVKPGHGESKPVERAFRDFCEDFSRHPACAGCYTGNSPLTRPDYPHKTKAMDFDVFTSLLDEAVQELNQRTGRRGEGLEGRSFEEVYNTTYATRVAAGRQAVLTDWDRASLWLASEAVTVRGYRVAYAGNFYDAPNLIDHDGKKIVIRFDPDDLKGTAWATELDGKFIGPLECVEKRGFDDQTAAQEDGRKNNRLKRATREYLAALRNTAALTPVIEPHQQIRPKDTAALGAKITKLALEKQDAAAADRAETAADRVARRMAAAAHRAERTG